MSETTNPTPQPADSPFPIIDRINDAITNSGSVRLTLDIQGAPAAAVGAALTDLTGLAQERAARDDRFTNKLLEVASVLVTCLPSLLSPKRD